VIRRWRIFHKGFGSAAFNKLRPRARRREFVAGCFLYNLMDKAQRHQYWTFRVGRSMFDVHSILLSIKPAAFQAAGPAET